MRRGRLTALVGTLTVCAVAACIAAPGAAAADPKQICADLADNGRLDGTYTQEELAAAMGSLQGYCTFVVVVTPPTPPPTPPVAPPPAPPTSPATQPVCVEVAPNTPGAVQAPNGKWYTGPNAMQCGPATPAPQVCTEVAAGTPGAVQAPNGKWYTNVPNGNAEACGPATPASTPPAPPAQPVGGTLPGEKTIVSQPKPVSQPAAQPAAQRQADVAGQQSPLRTTRTTGTLPFTGAELVIFALIGSFLIAAGLLLRATSRQKPEST